MKHQIHEEESRSKTSYSHGQNIGNAFSFSFTKLCSHSCLTELPPLCNASNGKLTAQTTSLKWKSIYSALACGSTWNPFLKSLTEFIQLCQIFSSKLKDHHQRMSMNLALMSCCSWETGMHHRYRLGDCSCFQQIHDRECLIPVPHYLEAAFAEWIPFWFLFP